MIGSLRRLPKLIMSRRVLPLTVAVLCVGVLAHGPDGPTFTYRPERLAALAAVAAACTGGSFVHAMASLLDGQVMFDSLPGLDVLQTTDAERWSDAAIARYQSALDALAHTYSIDR